jgi:hypothetical protein
MQTMAVQINDSYVQTFMKYVRLHSDNITITKEIATRQSETTDLVKRSDHEVMALCEKTIKYEKKVDKNLDYDPYFYERKEEIQQIRDDIKSGKSAPIPFDKFKKRSDKFMNELEIKYAHRT